MEDSPNHWRPGEYISPDPVQNPMEDFHSLVSSMQSSISSQLSKLNGTLATITSRLDRANGFPRSRKTDGIRGIGILKRN